MTRYTFLVVRLTKTSFPSSVYDIAIFPTTDDGATLHSPIFTTEKYLHDMAIIFGGTDTDRSRAVCAKHANCIQAYSNDLGENPMTVASALRCACKACNIIVCSFIPCEGHAVKQEDN
jgi:hypothetical protein